MGLLAAKKGMRKAGAGRMRESPFSPPTVVGEANNSEDEFDQRGARRLSLLNERATMSSWRSCPHCRLLGYLALFHKGHSLREHLRDHVLASRLELPPPIPDQARRFTDLWAEKQAKQAAQMILKKV